MFPSVLWRCYLGNRKGIWPVKNRVSVCWWHNILTGARLIAPVATTTTSNTLSCNKIQNGDILVPASPGSPGKWPLKWREREREREISHCAERKLLCRSSLIHQMTYTLTVSHRCVDFDCACVKCRVGDIFLSYIIMRCRVVQKSQVQVKDQGTI